MKVSINRVIVNNMKKYIFLGIFLGIFVFGGLCGGMVANAAETEVVKIDPNILFKKAADDLDKIKSGRYDVMSYLATYKADEEDPVYFAGIFTQGSYDSVVNLDGSVSYINSGSASHLVGDQKKSIEKSTDAVSVGGYSYMRFKDTKIKKLKNKWIKIPDDKYKEFAESINEKALFDAARLQQAKDDEMELLELVGALAVKNSLYVYNPDTGVVKNKKAKTTIYDLKYNPKTVVQFYRDLSTQIDPKLREGSVFSIDGFEKNLSNKFFVNYMVEHSYKLIVIDDKTQLPTSHFDVVTIPVFDIFGSISGDIQFVNSIDLTKINQKVNIKVPVTDKNTVSADDALKLLGIEF